MEIYLLRHGKTKGNLERRYVGCTDEPLLPESVPALKRLGGELLPVEAVYASKRLRCLQTAELLFPGKDPIVKDGLEEMNFGSFEYKNHEELKGDPAYQAWLKSGGALPFPAGEDIERFKFRCLNAFRDCLLDAKKKNIARAAFVVHGGTIMSVMEACAAERKSYYDWSVENGGGYLVIWDGTDPFENGEGRICLRVRTEIQSAANV